MRTTSIFNTQHVTTRWNRVAKRTQQCLRYVKALVNEDTLFVDTLWSMFLGLRKLGNICCGHRMFLNKIQNLCPQQMLRARANGETFVSPTMCPQQCVLVSQGLYIEMLRSFGQSKSNRGFNEQNNGLVHFLAVLCKTNHVKWPNSALSEDREPRRLLFKFLFFILHCVPDSVSW